MNAELTDLLYFKRRRLNLMLCHMEDIVALMVPYCATCV